MFGRLLIMIVGIIALGYAVYAILPPSAQPGFPFMYGAAALGLIGALGRG